MGILATALSAIYDFRDNTLLHRTGYTAVINGNTISMCCDCVHNITVHKLGIPVHQCDASFGIDGKPLVIIDPYNIPELCLLRNPEKLK